MKINPHEKPTGSQFMKLNPRKILKKMTCKNKSTWKFLSLRYSATFTFPCCISNILFYIHLFCFQWSFVIENRNNRRQHNTVISEKLAAWLQLPSWSNKVFNLCYRRSPPYVFLKMLFSGTQIHQNSQAAVSSQQSSIATLLKCMNATLDRINNNQ